MFVFDQDVQKATRNAAKRLPKWFNFHILLTGQGFAHDPDNTATSVVCSEPDAAFAPVNVLLLVHHAYKLATEHGINLDDVVAEVKKVHAN